MVRRADDRPEIRTYLLDAKRPARLFRAKVEIPAGQTAATRSDIDIFYDGLPEPIDLELDLKNRVRQRVRCVWPFAFDRM
jgi:hypothetical protein